MLAVLVILLLVFLSTQLALYLQKMAEGQLAADVLMRLTATMIPNLTGLLMPMAFFTAILLAYGRLYAESEMTVLQACGMSQLRLLGYTLALGVVVTLIVSLIVMVVSPRLMRYQGELLTRTAANNIVETIMPGQFQKTPDGTRVFYVEKMSRDRHMIENIFTAQQGVKQNPLDDKKKKAATTDKGHAWDVVFAKHATQKYEPKKGGMFLVAHDGYRYIGTPGQLNYLIVKYGTYAVRLPSPSSMGNISDSVAAMPTSVLLANYHNPEYAAEFQWRVSIPLQTFILCILAVPLSRTKPRQGRYAPLLPAILIYVFYANFMFAARDWVQKGNVPIWLGMWWIHVILLALAYYLFIGKPGWSKVMNLLLGSFSKILPTRKDKTA